MILKFLFKKLGLVGLAFFIFATSLNAQPTHKIVSSFGVEFNLPTTWHKFTQEELVSAKLTNPSLEAGTTEIIINTISVKDTTNQLATTQLDNLVLSLSNYRLPTQPRQIKNACQSLVPKLLAANELVNEITRCQVSKIQKFPVLIIGYTADAAGEVEVLQYLIQIKPQTSLNATLTFQAQNSSSAAAFEAAMMKLKVLP